MNIHMPDVLEPATPENEKNDAGKGFTCVFWLNKQAAVIGLSILVYFTACVILYANLEGWNVVTCLYFAVVVVTTVGYGDFLPSTDASKLVTIVLSHFALVIVAFAIGHVVDVVRRVFLEVVHADDDGLGIFNTQAIRRRRRVRSLLSLGVYLVILLIGTIVFATCVEWGDRGNNWINGFYLTVVTVTTIGFGDYSPAGSIGLKVFGCFLMMIGIPAAVTALALMTELIFGENRDDVKLKVIQDHMTRKKFEGLNAFVEEMRDDGVGNYRDQGKDKISRFEFLCFVLVKNEILELKNIKNVMKNFDDLDKTGTGMISREDISRSMGDTVTPSQAASSPV